jgi:hypothetical protein
MDNRFYSQPHEEKKKSGENQKPSNDGMNELTQLIKQMEINHANQINALQNRLITMERSQSNRKQHKPNDKWLKRPPKNDQRPPNPFVLSIKVALRWTSSEPPKFEHHLFKIQSSEVQSVVKTTFSLYISIKNCNKRCLHDELVKGLSHLKS